MDADHIDGVDVPEHIRTLAIELYEACCEVEVPMILALQSQADTGEMWIIKNVSHRDAAHGMTQAVQCFQAHAAEEN